MRLRVHVREEVQNSHHNNMNLFAELHLIIISHLFLASKLGLSSGSSHDSSRGKKHQPIWSLNKHDLDFIISVHDASCLISIYTTSSMNCGECANLCQRKLRTDRELLVSAWASMRSLDGCMTVHAAEIFQMVDITYAKRRHIQFIMCSRWKGV